MTIEESACKTFSLENQLQSVSGFLGKRKKRLITELKRNGKYPQKNIRRKINVY